MTISNRVVTLIANPANACLSPDLASDVQRALNSSSHYFLADGIACDIPVPDTTVEVDETISGILKDLSVDWVLQNADERRKKVLLADMDSTMIEQECIDELAAEAGIGDQVATITARAMRGEIEFEPALRERTSLLKGQPASIIKHVIDNKITLMPGGAELIATMKANGAYCALVSGGFTQFTSAIAEKLGFDEHRANTFEFANDMFTGSVIPPILGKEAKVDALNEIAEKHNLQPSDFIAVGDGANDIGMLQLAGSSVALHAKPIVAEHARFRINHGDLTALLYIQGYRKSDFVV